MKVGLFNPRALVEICDGIKVDLERLPKDQSKRDEYLQGLQKLCEGRNSTAQAQKSTQKPEVRN